jgi:hypothetical protein
MSSILKGLNESYSRDEENQQNAMDARRSSDLNRERNAGLNEPDELPTTSVETRNGVYEYNVPAGQEDIAKDLGLQHHRGHWVSRIPIQRANFQFGRPQFHEIPVKGVAEGLLNELFDHQQEYFKLADGQVIRVDYRQSGLNPDGMPGTIKIVSVNPKIMPMSGMQSIQPWDKARQNIRMAIQKWVQSGQQGVAEASKEQEYGPEWDEKIKRLGQMAKQGERKTVWDPVKRVYKTVPVQQSSIKEGLDELDENLNKWFKEKWVRFGPDGKIRGDCARGDDSEGKPKCLPQSKAQNLGKKGRASAAARKRREDPNPERSGKAINVNTKKKSNEGVAEGLPQTLRKVVPGYAKREIDRKMDAGKFGKTDADKDANFQRYKKIQDKLKEQGVAEEQLDELKCWDGYTRVQGVPAGAPGSCKKKTNEEEHNEKCPECGGPMFSDLLLAEKKDACYNKVRSRYKVWPSAYASGALVQCRKKGAANWGTGGKKNESVEEGIDPNNPWGDQGRFAGDVKHDISTTIKYPKWQIGLPVFVKHIGQKGMIDSLYSDSAIVGVGGRQYRVPLGGLKRYPINEAELDEGQIYAGGNKPAGMRKYEPRTVPSQAELSKKESAIMKGLQLEGNDEEYHTGGSLGTPYPGTYEQETLPYRTKGQKRTQSIALEDEQLDEKWSDKYKDSINCSNPKGFSQKAHCQGRKK